MQPVSSTANLVEESTAQGEDELQGTYRGKGVKDRMRIRVPAELRRTSKASSDEAKKEVHTKGNRAKGDREANSKGALNTSKKDQSIGGRKRYTFVATGQRDDLAKLKGLSNDHQQALYSMGITRFAQIGKLTKDERHFIASEVTIIEKRELKLWRNIVRDKGHLSEKTLRAKQKNKPASKVKSKTSFGNEKKVGVQPTSSPDDLRLIKGIGTVLEKKLNLLGITRFEQIARWNKSDADKIDQELDFKGRVEREEWIEQAQRLSRDSGQRVHRSSSSNSGSSTSSSSKGRSKTKKSSGSQTPPNVSELTLLDTSASKGSSSQTGASSQSRNQGSANAYSFASMSDLDDEAIRALTAYGVKDVRGIANWSDADIDLFDRQSGLGQRVRRENWVKNAFSRVKSRQSGASSQGSSSSSSSSSDSRSSSSQYDRSYDRGDRSGSRAQRDRSERSREYESRDWSDRSRDNAERDRNRHERDRSKSERKREKRDGRSDRRDDLSRIRSLNDLTIRMLNERGVLRYKQIAKWSDDDVARFDRELSLNGQIRREDWVAQARSFSGASKRVQKDRKALETGDGDDLKRIRGVGKRIEELLNERGITTYQQIADFTPEVIKKLNGELRFRGRIEREQWLKQAKLLAAGEDTEFSKRVDKGQVPSSRDDA